MKKNDVLVKREALQKALDELPIVCCGSCENRDAVLKICKLAGEAPPPEVQPVGCDEWIWDGIAF